ncbi:MAG TPA: CDP-diacylglycerol--glycerol-3-phosphate 3-phosphatidyltransferase [Candidatus Omnitrophota bacterium]|jgi:CDP-diacylglycerol--glycerol-3-phosphate 3-phosphatidyltransferase|nr:CDP-diacylglycerol--glycerol-3-phosphate 3-phosphatidyltransferase [Candidatus Omnitrophota bacterium]HPN56232.1 CDP-diacylglycerol--glycerol-3-phosphate 3-phosphatidyltransferase [Candidatus Omnitrophota bacterium]
MNVPNVLTVSRIFLTLGFIFFIKQGDILSVCLAGCFFVLASVTDYYDGYFAKKRNQVSNFGKIMDPIADKFLILSAFYIFMRMHIVASWIFYLIALREILLTGFRLTAMLLGRVLAAERAGKIKTVLQMSSIWVILLSLVLQDLHVFQPREAFGSPFFFQFWQASIDVLLIMTVIATVYSGVIYLFNNRISFMNT